MSNLSDILRHVGEELHVLDQLWKVIGDPVESQSTKPQQAAELRDQVLEPISRLIAANQALQTQLNQTIKQLEQQILTYSLSLNIPHAPVSQFPSNH
jgi:hypothetical protein